MFAIYHKITKIIKIDWNRDKAVRTEARRERLERFFRPAEFLRPDHDQLSLRAAILVIGGLSLALWSAIIGVVVGVF